mgnify:CR=1 FL=1
MENEYNKWNIKKQHLNAKNNIVYFKERDIWWCSIGVNIGSEQKGKGESYSRPVLVSKKFGGGLFWGIPLSSVDKQGKFYLNISFNNGEKSTALLTHMRLYDSKRLIKKLSKISEPELVRIKQAIHVLLG